ncbi:SusC/RagA family TonB-linked outer membrane protein [Niabella beijingensis]|uniref:SusC/RagA family TonB-linked outer membrane protein n=1 Tax=Niabella beijingensis TaxID=2872700 RepID=UPI001CC127EF|nr:SusC/RagA family TonB-linked outer membrane protein [Niabella beijingensis]MBZ4190287.1 SusC/RagA family TonB-linked outer membrane protein [Niabella beijingensis]
MRRKLTGASLLILFCYFVPLTGTGQTTTSVNGVVTNEEDEPLIQVTVVARNTTNAKLIYQTTTDSTGVFRFGAVNPEGRYSFTFSNIGYKEHTITGYSLNAQGNTSIVVKLKKDSLLMQDVVVTGFQRIDRRKFTGSVVQVDRELINRSGYMDVSKMLQGAAAGVSVSSPSGTFGATPKIRIHGNASISANQEPLYVLNGVPISAPANVTVNQLYSGDPASLLSSVIAGLNANDIEDISILKDGSATALYGTRAANGIISITTKKGRKGDMNINFSSALSMGLKPDIDRFNLMNSKQQIELARDLYNYGYLSVLNYPTSTGAFTDAYFRYAENLISKDQFNKEVDNAAYRNTNWFDVLFKNNLVQEHSLSLSGGSEKATYYLSGSYAGDNGASIGYNTKRYTIDLRTIINVTKRMDLDVDLTANFRDQMAPGTFNSTTPNGTVSRAFELNPTIYATTTSRAMSPYNEDGSYKYYRRNYAPFNILDELNENFTGIKTQGIAVTVRPSYKFTKDLTLEVLLSARKNRAEISHVMTEYSNVAAAYRADYPDPVRSANPYLFKDPTDPNSIPETILPRGGILDAYNSNGTELYGRATLNYVKQITNQHRLTFFGGVEIRSNSYESDSTRAYGYLYYGGKIISPSQQAMKYAILNDERYYRENFINERAVGGFLNVQYTLKNRYNLDLMARSDGSNVFGTLTRSRFLPNYNVGVSWNVDREQFFETLKLNSVIDRFTIRGSYALRGNAYNTSPMLNGQFYNAVRVDDVNSQVGLRIFSPELYNLAWEKDYITNIGLDIAFLKRYSIVAEYYSRKNENLIAPGSMPFEEGFASKVINWASMTNKGFDFTFNVSNWFNSNKFRWGTGIIYGYVKNTMIDGVLQSPLLTNVTRPEGFGKIGKPLYGLYAYNFAGLDANGQPTFAIGNTGRRIDNVLLSSTNDSLVSYMGPREPTTTGSFSNTFGYGPFELRIFFTYSYGNKVFRNPMVQRTYADNLAVAQDIDARWRSAGDEQFTNIPGLVSSIQAAYLASAGIQNEFAYNRSDIMVAKADVLRLSEVMLSYDVNRKALERTRVIKSLRIMASANNIYYWADRKLRGVDPESLITGVALPNTKSYSLRILAQF